VTDRAIGQNKYNSIRAEEIRSWLSPWLAKKTQILSVYGRVTAKNISSAMNRPTFCIFRSSNRLEAFLALFLISFPFTTVDFWINVHFCPARLQPAGLCYAAVTFFPIHSFFFFFFLDRLEQRAGLWSRSRRFGLETVSRRINVSSRSRLDKNCQRLGLVSVSAINVSCPRPIFRQILQVTIIKLIKSVVAVNKSLAELV